MSMTPMQQALREVLRLRATPEGRAELARRLKAAGGAVEAPRETPPASHVAHHIQRAGVPAALIRIALIAGETPSLKAAREWTGTPKRERPALVLAGDVGVGKSVAAVWACLEWACTWPWNSAPTGAESEPLVWLDATRLRRLGGWDAEAARILDVAEHARLTVLDDAGWDADRRAQEAVAAVLQARVDNGRATVLTSNLKGEQFRARYGVPLCDRLKAKAVILTATGKSMRNRPEARP